MNDMSKWGSGSNRPAQSAGKANTRSSVSHFKNPPWGGPMGGSDFDAPVGRPAQGAGSGNSPGGIPPHAADNSVWGQRGNRGEQVFRTRHAAAAEGRGHPSRVPAPAGAPYGWEGGDYSAPTGRPAQGAGRRSKETDSRAAIHRERQVRFSRMSAGDMDEFLNLSISRLRGFED